MGPGRVLFYFVQFATALILFTGGNTSFNGFPFLASFVAQDAFLPRWLTKRGHRLVFSNGIIVLTVVSLALMLAVGANVNKLVPFYAIGVFTGFSMAGFGMSKYHLEHREQGWRHRLVINFSAGVVTGFIVLIFAVTKFTEGAWLIVIVGPILVFTLIRLNREYRAEDQVLENIGDRRAAGVAPRQPNYTRRTVLVFVDSMDLATLAALRYARSLRPTSLRAVHFVIDGAKAELLRERWVRFGQDVPFEMIDTPDRRLGHAPRNSSSARPSSRGLRSPWCCRGAASPRSSAGCCTTGRRTRSRRRSAGSRTRPRSSSRSTWKAGSGCWRNGRRPGPGATGRRTSTRPGNSPRARLATGV